MMKKIFAVICVAVVLAANAATILAYHQDIFSFIVVRTRDLLFSPHFPEEETVIELPTSEGDPYGIRARCAEFGLDVEVPTYLPEGFVLWDVKQIENKSCKTVTFWLKRKELHLKLSYTELYDWNARIIIPSDDFNLEEIVVNGKPGITSKEDGQYNLVYYDGNLEYLITSDKLSYEECNKIVASIK